MKDSFILYSKYKEVFENLTDEQAGQLIKGIFNYIATEQSGLDGLMTAVFTPIKQDLDRNNAAYEAVCERNRTNGSKGGRPKKKTQKTQSVILKTQRNPKNLDNEYDNDNEYEYATAIAVAESDSCANGSQSDSRVDEIIRFYEENIGAITPYEFNLLDSYRSDFSDDIIIYALKLQVEAKATSIKYAKAILNNWQKKNIKTLLDAERENEKKKVEVEKEKKVNNLYQSNDSQYQNLDRFYSN